MHQANSVIPLYWWVCKDKLQTVVVALQGEEGVDIAMLEANREPIESCEHVCMHPLKPYHPLPSGIQESNIWSQFTFWMIFEQFLKVT